MVNNLLKECMEHGILLDKEVRDLLGELSEEEGVVLIRAIAESGIKGGILNRAVFDENVNGIKASLMKLRGSSFSGCVFEKIGMGAEGVSEKNISSCDSRESDKGDSGIRVLSAPAFIKRKIAVGDFIRHFKSRYDKIKPMLENKGFENLTSIRKIGRAAGSYTVIVAVLDKKTTKNNNILLEVEDLTGSAKVLINNSRESLFDIGKSILPDDIIAINVSGGGDILFANEIFYPGCGLDKRKYIESDNLVAFISDMHVGSTMFLEDRFVKFIDWLNGKRGSDSQKKLASKIKYLFIAGDAVDGVNHAPGQEKYLNIKTTVEQYKKLEELLSLIRNDIQIIMCPGQHDAVWVGEPQPIVDRKFAPGLHKMSNLHLVPNPSLVDVESGLKVLMYHGASINYFINELSEIRAKHKHDAPTRVVQEMLKRRHLAPLHGLADYIPCEDDGLVINEIPDILFTGDQHRAEVSSMNNVGVLLAINYAV